MIMHNRAKNLVTVFESGNKIFEMHIRYVGKHKEKVLRLSFD